MAGVQPMATDVAHQPPHGFWTSVRDVVRCNRKDGKRWQCSREVVPGQKYCERHVGRGRNRPKRSAEAYSATSDVPCTPSLGAISSVSMAAAAQGAVSGSAYSNWQQPSSMASDRFNPVAREAGRAGFPTGFEKVARVKILYDRVRSNFPYFDPTIVRNPPAFMENAGGSQCPQVVIDAISNYMRTSFVQVGAGYELSRRATETVKAAHDHMKTFTNAHGFGEVVLGSSTSQLLTTLSHCYAQLLKEGDEIIVHEANHEANAGPWVRMAARCGATVKWWRINYDTFESDLDDLVHLLSPRTRIVAVPHVSNLLGEILDLEKVVKIVKSRIYEESVRVVADGVAYAPHRAVDVGKWGVDWYVFSTYKTFGPHMAVLYGSQEAFADVRDESPNWHFLTGDDPAKNFELGGVCHEGCAGLVSLTQYFGALSRIGEAFSLSSSDGGKKELQQQAQQQQQQQPQHSSSSSGGKDAGGGGQAENGGFTLFDTGGGGREVENNSNTLSPVADGTRKGGAWGSGSGSLDLLQPVPVAVVMDGMSSSSFRDWEFALQGTSFGQEAIGLNGTVSARLDRVVVEAAYDTIALLEQPLQEKLLAYLRSRNDVVIVGPKSAAGSLRVPTVSFIHKSKTSSDISVALQSAGFAIRHGHMYCYRFLSGMVAHSKLTVNSLEDGVVRISMVHYNTPLEVARLLSCLQMIL